MFFHAYITIQISNDDVDVDDADVDDDDDTKQDTMPCSASCINITRLCIQINYRSC
jgi:hypothetical protein